MTPETVFDGGRLNAVVFNPNSDRLFVSFRQRVGDHGAFHPPRPVMGFINRGYAHLHIQSRHNDWFINDETKDFERILTVLASEYRETVSMGFSMGGYGALRFAKTLGLSRVLAISPQFSISKRVVPFDKRYRTESRGWNARLGDLASRSCDVTGAVLVDPFQPMDLANAQMIGAAFPKLRLVRLGCGGHPATRAILQGGQFGQLKGRFADGALAPQDISGLHRKARRDSESYWKHMEKLALGHGRQALADHAARQAQMIADKTGKRA